jgi:general secretion pathway protein E
MNAVGPMLPLPLIPYGFAKRFGVIVLGEDGERCVVGLRDGDDARALTEIRRVLARPLRAQRVAPRDFDRLLSERYAADGLDAAGVAGDLDRSGSLDSLIDEMPAAEDLLASQDDAPVIRLINGVIAEAVRQGASDVHIEPYEESLLIRLRVDGVLREVLRLPARIAQMLVSRVKVMARLDIAERRVPQDGRVGLTLGGRSLDVRVSTLPSRHGERVVLRILDKEQAGLSLIDLGLTRELFATVQKGLAEPNGIILVTGPTGSGKTTTLYAGLRTLNDGSRNILTVEDPVEYAIEGVGQTQVNPKVGLSFAAGLRAILRQDPDIVMVGEIRDTETATIAVQASLTGHLVLSTVHTNDAVGAITRLRDMGVEPFLLASTLRLVIAQRLVRRLCPDCRQPEVADAPTAALIGLKPGATVYRPAGCAACNGTGFSGRTGIYEAVPIDDQIRAFINRNADEAAIGAHAFRRSASLAVAARRAVAEGVTTVEEAVRITRTQEAGDAGL